MQPTFPTSSQNAPPLSLFSLALPFQEQRFSVVKRNASSLSTHFIWCPIDITPEFNHKHIIFCQQEQQDEQGYYFVILDAEGRMVGEIGLDEVFLDQQFGNVFYWIDEQQQGKGLATIAVALLSKWARLHLKLKYLEIKIDTDNIQSQRVAEKCGAVFKSVVTNYFHQTGKVSDVNVYNLMLLL